MPYIKQEFRKAMEKEVEALAKKITEIHENDDVQTRDGLLNYAITKILMKVYKNPRYHDFNEIIGMLECCKLEYYRKLTGPYEDLKEKENGKV